MANEAEHRQPNLPLPEFNKSGKHGLSYRFDLVPPAALKAVAAAMYIGEARGRPDDGWQSYSVDYHLNHALAHINQWMLDKGSDSSGGSGEDHLGHAITRLMMVYELTAGER